MTRKLKLSFSELCNLISYYDFCDASVTREDGTKVKGVLYKVDKMLTDKEKTELLKFKNVRLFVSQCQYAPEIRKSCVFLGNKCI